MDGPYCAHVPDRGEAPVRRLLVVEDDVMTAGLLSRVLTAESFEVHVAYDAVTARKAVDEIDPDGALIDVSLGAGPTGADLAHALHRDRPDIALLLITRFPDLRSAGLADYEVPPNCGFVRKDRMSDPGYLVDAIERVMQDHAREVRDDTDPTRPLGELSAHQLEILRLIALGYTNDAIARIRSVTRSSVERWVAGILQAMGIDSTGDLNPRVEAARRYIDVVGVPRRE